MSLHLLRVRGDRKPFELAIGLGLGLIQVSESRLSLFLWHEARSRRMFRHLVIKRFLLRLLVSLVLVLVDVAGDLAVVFVSASD